MSACILGMGTAVPEGRLTQDRAADLAIATLGLDAQAARSVRALYRRTAVERRGSVLLKAGEEGGAGFQRFYAPAGATGNAHGPGTAARMAQYREHAPPLAEAACRAALADARHCWPGFEAESLTHLVVVSCTGFFAPGLDYELIQRLGLAPTVQRFCLGFMGCHGGFNGLQLAAGLAAADPAARVLLCSVELCSLHFQYSDDPGQITANALFADGAGAAVIGGGMAGAWRILASASRLIGGTGSDMGWVVGDHGFRMHLSPRVPGLIGDALRPWLEPWLAGRGLALDEARTWAVHPGGPRILSAVAEGLGLDDSAMAASRAVLREFGNMSSATVWFILRRLREAGAAGACVMLGFGPGLMAEAVLLEVGGVREAR
ncbi:type III polyketide synthase [Methylomagnum sp.]